MFNGVLCTRLVSAARCKKSYKPISAWKVPYSEFFWPYSVWICLRFYLSIFSIHLCIKSVQIRSFSGPYFPAFGLNTERYKILRRPFLQKTSGRLHLFKNTLNGKVPFTKESMKVKLRVCKKNEILLIYFENLSENRQISEIYVEVIHLVSRQGVLEKLTFLTCAYQGVRIVHS